MSHAFYSTGLAIALPRPTPPSTFEVIRRFFSRDVLLLLLGVAATLVAVGWLMYWVEGRAKEVADPKRKALSSAMFWAFEPVIGYPASKHKSRGGRILGTLWGVFGLVFVTSLTARLTSQMTADQLTDRIQGPADLGHLRVGTVKMSQAGVYCDRRGIAPLARRSHGCAR